MIKHICDICNKIIEDESELHKFSVRMEKKCMSEYGLRKRMEDIEICNHCYKKFVRIVCEKRLEDDCVSKLLEMNKIDSFNTDELQSAYLQGAEDMMGVMLPKRLIR